MSSYAVPGRVLVMALMACALLTPASSTGATSARVVSARGSWTLSRLGSSDLVLPLKEKMERRSVSYGLPQHARQGPAYWFLMHLHFQITFPRHNPPGFVFVSGLTNGKAAALVEFQVMKRVHGVSRIRWSAVNYIRGKTEGTTTGRSIEIHFTNYLQYAGVQPGKNTFTVQLERYTATRAVSLRVFKDSGISSTPLSPAHLILALDDDVKKVRVGDRFAVRYTLRNTGDRPGQKVVITPEFRRGTIGNAGPSVRRLKPLRGTAHGTLWFRALRTGVFPLGVFVSSGSNKPGQLVEIQVSARPTALQTFLRFLPHGVGGMLLLAGLLFMRPGRRRPSSHA
jgi:hypothetical protein